MLGPLVVEIGRCPNVPAADLPFELAVVTFGVTEP